jgi:hypothetical protein
MDGMQGPISWTPQSSDRTPFDVLWDFAKDLIYQSPITDSITGIGER